MPEAIYRDITKFTPKTTPKTELDLEPEIWRPPSAGFLPSCSFVRILPKIRCLAHLGLGPVRLFPHQVRVVNSVRERYLFRILFADEVGLGKTIEAGACIKLLWATGYVHRVLDLAPKNVTGQW